MWRSATSLKGILRRPSRTFSEAGILVGSAHNPGIQVRHGKIGTVEGGHRLVAPRLHFETDKVPDEIGLEAG